MTVRYECLKSALLYILVFIWKYFLTESFLKVPPFFDNYFNSSFQLFFKFFKLNLKKKSTYNILQKGRNLKKKSSTINIFEIILLIIDF